MSPREAGVECRVATVTSVDERDLPAVYTIEVESFDNPYPYWYLTLLLHLAGPLFLAARNPRGEAVGYIVGLPLQGGVCHVASIAVAARCRRRGIGSMLLESLAELCAAEGRRILVLEADITNHAALMFYASHGFTPIGFTADYYGPGRHAVKLARVEKSCGPR